MIDNVILLITGALHERNTEDLLEKCHPLGKFEAMAALSVASNVADLYNIVLVETPIAAYFKNCLSAQDLDDMNIEIIRNTLYKAYLEDFYAFCSQLDEATSAIMCEVIKFEADRRILNITINSFGTEVSREDRMKLYPRVGSLFPEVATKLSKADDLDQVKASCDSYPTFRKLFDPTNDKSLEEKMLEHEVFLNKLAFESQLNFSSFYAYAKLKEQEIRNIVWIAECISQKQKDKINNYIPIF